MLKIFSKYKSQTIEKLEAGRGLRGFATSVEVRGFDSYIEEPSLGFGELWIYEIPSKLEKEFKESFKESAKPNMSEVREELRGLSRTVSKTPQEDIWSWKDDREGYYTSTNRPFNKMGGSVESSIGKAISGGVKKSINENDQLMKYIIESENNTALQSTAWGKNREARTIGKVEQMLNVSIRKSGFTAIDSSLLGDSPDGYFIPTKTVEVTDEFGERFLLNPDRRVEVEVKNPKFSNFVQRNLYKDYIEQCKHHCFVNGSDYCILAIDFPTQKPKLYVIYLDDEYILMMIRKYGDLEVETIRDIEKHINRERMDDPILF